MRFRHFLLVLLLPLGASVPSPAGASRFVELSLDQMIRGAAVILEGDVVSTRSDWTPDATRIYTTVTLRVDAVHKGSVGGSTVDLRLLGGTVDEVTMAVIGQSRFTPGEQVFLFLAPNYQTNGVPVMGGEAGKLVVTTDAAGADVLLGPRQTFEKSDVTRDIRSVMRPIGQ